jgi:hypothetical protein
MVLVVLERRASFAGTTTDVEIECLRRRVDNDGAGVCVGGASGFNAAESSMLEPH